MKKTILLLTGIILLMSSCSLFIAPEVRFRNNMLDNVTLEGLKFDEAVHDKNIEVGTSTKYRTTSTGIGTVYYKSSGTWYEISDKITLDWGKNTIFVSGTVDDFSCTAQKDTP